MTTNHFDAIVIGAGHNGLIAAAYLARAGKKVCILERREIVGGAAMTEEIFPGYRFTEFSYVVSLLRPEIIRDLELPRHPERSDHFVPDAGRSQALARSHSSRRSMK